MKTDTQWHRAVPLHLHNEFLEDEVRYTHRELELFDKTVHGRPVHDLARSEVLKKRDEFYQLWCKVKSINPEQKQVTELK